MAEAEQAIFEFDRDAAPEAQMEKLDKDRDMRDLPAASRNAAQAGMSKEALWYDDAILHYRYHKLKTTKQEYEGWSAEDMVNLHARIVQELKRRGLPHFDRGDELDKDTRPFLKEYAEVKPSGDKLGEPITLDEVLPHLKTFKLRQPYVYLVGGLVVHGKTEGDIDILIKDSEDLPDEFRHVLEWRIMRSLPEKFWDRVQFHYDSFHGPFTDNMPVFDLTIERVNEDNQVFRMDADTENADVEKQEASKEAPPLIAWVNEQEQEELGKQEPDTVEQAEASAKEGRVFQEKEITEEGETVYLDMDIAGIDEAFEKANYVGNKRRLSKYIAGKFPDDGKTIFDCMCGCSAVLIEAARRGYQVKGNDLSIVPYWYSKGVFEGAQLTEADIEKLKNAAPHDGWLTTGWKGVYPRPRHIRRFLDGLAKKARQWQGAKGWAAKAVASRVLQTLYSDSISGFSTIRYETEDAVKRIVERSAKEVNGLIAEVSGKGKITNDNAVSMSYPRADVVYFDPPFFKRDKGYVHYFQTYKIMNSTLLGRDWKEANLKPEDIPAILERLCKSCKHIFISTSSNEVVSYGKELSRHKKSMKRYRVAYTQTSGFGSRDDHQREHLYVAKAEKVDPYLRLPSENKTHRYVVQEHFRGKSMHADFRIESVGNDDLIGWTLNTLIKGGIKEPVETVAQARALKTEDYSKINWETGEFMKRKKEGAEALVDVEIVSQRKAVEPHAWLDIEGVVKPGNVGATKEYPGVFHVADKGVCEYGGQKPWFHEYFPHSDKSKGGFRYRIFFRQLRVADIKGEEEKALSPELLKEYIAHDPDIEREDWDEGYWEFLKDKGEVVLPAAETKFRRESAWLLIKPIDQTPYVLSDGAVEKEWVPPKGYSALPKAVRSKVPHDYRYWQMERESERREMRDALVKAIDEGEVKLPLVEKQAEIESDEFEKRRRVPFNQWGGSSKYAAALASRLPEHKRYVEPFCGSAAVFFAKEPVEDELLADTDPEVVFALRYIQRLSKQGFEALKRFPWTVSRAGFERVKSCKPSSDAERFWKHVYSRQCTWGGKPKASGYSTISDGKSYDLDSLWNFKERLKGARIANQDWKKTLAECDGPDTLFFIDPPYVDEWAHGQGIPPEEVAEVISKLKGEFVVVYTDSARARRALSKAGRLFKMKIPETRYRGLWQKRNRLFVASAGIKKALDDEFVEDIA